MEHFEEEPLLVLPSFGVIFVSIEPSICDVDLFGLSTAWLLLVRLNVKHLRIKSYAQRDLRLPTLSGLIALALVSSPHDALHPRARITLGPEFRVG
uniref:Iron transport multicopper oxidase FET3 ) n=1 Tax=Ganoderma boninense TaxID=34458 RepID=A0A5K1K3A7_9APHY|nr:Iron transport multicopper oxidase FET3 (EC (Cell surface ferroxidase FET3) [Ganoderma boninense]